MHSSKIEVGDVFTHKATGLAEYTAVEVRGDKIKDETGDWNSTSCCTLVRKVNPYAGLTLPEPPAGYRLAKWGEDVPEKSLWWDCDEQGDNGTWDNDWRSPHSKWPWSQWRTCLTQPSIAIFAIPLDQPSPLKSWQFREVPLVQPEPKTLADVPDDVDVIATSPTLQNAEQIVMRCRGGKAYFPTKSGERESSFTPNRWSFVRYLDPPPQKTLSLDDVPDGRVIRCQDRWHWRVGPTWWGLSNSGGVWPNLPPKREIEFTITDYIAEFRGPA